MRREFGLILVLAGLVLAGGIPGQDPAESDFGAPVISPASDGPRKYEPTDDLPWQFRANHPEGTSRFGGVFDMTGKFHAICGNCNGHVAHPYDEVWSPVSNSWARGLTHPGGNVGVYNHDVVRIDQTIYVGGGSQGGGTYYNSLTALDLAASTWRVRTSMPLNSFIYYSFAAANGDVYCLGGYNGAAVLNTNYRYDPVRNGWAARAPMPAPRRNPATAVVGDTIYVFGGMSANDYVSTTSTLWKYNWLTNTWTTGADMPGPLGWARAVVLAHPDSGPMVYVMGGYSAGTIVSTVYRYSVDYGNWSSETPLLAATRSHAADAQGGMIFVAGGYDVGILLTTQSAELSYPDVQTVEILVPSGPVPRGTLLSPRATVRNNSTTTQTFGVRLTIGDGYNCSRTCTLEAGALQAVSFDDWTANTPGSWETRCTTMLAGDVFPDNDLVTGSVVVPGNDLQVVRILVPADTIEQGTVVSPRATVRNNGTQMETFRVRFVIADGYSDTQTVTELGPGMESEVSFDEWTAGTMGEFALSCSTLTDDDDPENNCVRGAVLVRAVDIGIDVIIAPVWSVMDSGTTITPQALVHNHGNTPATFDATFYIGTQYVNSQQVAGLLPDSVLTISFVPWTAEERGRLTVRCTLMVPGDMNPANDGRDDSVYVRVRNALTVSIDAPVGSIDSGLTTTPQATVRNAGTGIETFDVTFSIGTLYTNTKPVVDLAPGTEQIVDFDLWTAEEPGALITKCSTRLARDMAPDDDVRTGTVNVRVAGEDVGTFAINAPTGNLDSGQVVTPQARVHNYGRVASTFDVLFTIGADYASQRTVTALAPNADLDVDFDPWTALPRGPLPAKCTTLLESDEDNSNDRAEVEVRVHVHDAAAVQILRPEPSIPPGALTPTAVVRNPGTAREPVVATFIILGAAYTDRKELPDGLPVGMDTTLEFVEWTASTPGGDVAKCSLYQAGDQVIGNDIVFQSFSVGMFDVGVEVIRAPAGAVDSNSVVTPHAVVKNYSGLTASFPTFFRIEDSLGATVYRDSQFVADLPSAGTASVLFADWPPPLVVGNYTTRCSTGLAGDGLPDNDTLSGTFTVTTTPTDTGWVAKRPVPAGAKSKNVKDGGSLAYMTLDSDTGFIYAFKGNNTFEFYRYNTRDNTWLTRESIPAFGRAAKKKGVKKGAALTATSSRVFGAKGNGTYEFWCYTPGSDSAYAWSQMADIPVGEKSVKEGSGAVAVTVADTTWVYFLKGSGTAEFYCYDITTNNWSARLRAPLGASGKMYKNGSQLAYDGDRTIYAIKGSYNEFYAYRTDSDEWVTLATLPFIGPGGKKKKVKDGAALAWRDGHVYALKGGNTLEFWKYSADSDRWTAMPDIPYDGNKRVKGGGAMVYAENPGRLYALKGNNTLQFFQYGFSGVAGGTRLTANGPNALSGSIFCNPQSAIRISPNPFSNAAVISCAVSRAGPVRVAVYDVTGKLVTMLREGFAEVGTHMLTLGRTQLVPGIYVVRLESGGSSATAKLVVQ